ncbi:MAG: DUF4012 domain-containing protein [Anaerolineales bacterium]|nr:DUF4012 domain-containing protein [Anaerolineales bacterium]
MSASTKRRLPQYILLGGLLLIIVALLLKGWRIYRLVDSLQARQTEAEALLAAGPMNVEPAAAESLLLGLREDVVGLQAEVGPFLPLASRFGWLPKVGGLLAVSPQLMEMADAGTAGALFAFNALEPALAIVQNSGGGPASLPALVGVVADGQADLIQAQLAVDRVTAARAEIDNLDELPWRVQQLFKQLDDNLPLAQDGLRAIQLLPELMGQNGRRTYLILAQNEDELRPSGGFISGAGLLTVEAGNIVSMAFQDANYVDDFDNKDYGPAPEPLLNFMGLYYLLFRDANWYADFPTTAQLAMDLYTYGQDVPLDGVIALDKRFVELLLTATGPVFVPELDATMRANNVVELMREAWGIQEGEDVSEWIVSRKEFIGPLALAIRAQLENSLGELDPVQFAQIMETAIAEKHLQLYFRDPATEAILTGLGWDSAIDRTPAGDLLFLVEANLGYSKVNPAIERQLNYTVFLDNNGGGNARTTIEFRHLSPENGNGCEHYKTYAGGLAYNELLDDCYWVYFQVYAPAGSLLQQSSVHPVAATDLITNLAWPGQATAVTDPVTGLSLFANFMLLHRAQTQTAFFLYALPAGVSQHLGDGVWRYSLLVQKQPGLANLPLQIQVVLPEGMAPLALPAGATQDGDLITLTTILTRDERFEFLYQ